jgi:hypothetical protein
LEKIRVPLTDRPGHTVLRVDFGSAVACIHGPAAVSATQHTWCADEP